MLNPSRLAETIAAANAHCDVDTSEDIVNVWPSMGQPPGWHIICVCTTRDYRIVVRHDAADVKDQHLIAESADEAIALVSAAVAAQRRWPIALPKRWAVPRSTPLLLAIGLASSVGLVASVVSGPVALGLGAAGLGAAWLIEGRPMPFR